MPPRWRPPVPPWGAQQIRDLPKMEQYAGGAGFATFVIFAAHIDKPAKFDKAVTMLATFRNYLHYHIKVSFLGGRAGSTPRWRRRQRPPWPRVRCARREAETGLWKRRGASCSHA